MYVFNLLIKFDFSRQHLNTGKFLTCFDKTMENTRSGDTGPNFDMTEIISVWVAASLFRETLHSSF